MVFAPSDKHRAVLVHKDAVRPRELAAKWVAVRAIALHSRARKQFDGSLFQIHKPDAVALRVGKKDATIRRDADAFRPAEDRCFCRSAIA